MRTLYDPSSDVASTDAILDSQALLLYFRAPRSATGEDILELHVHGGPAVVKSVLNAISRCRRSLDVRYAEPGEFTRRAFFNGRLDLTQVEALGDTLHAVTEQQRRLAVRATGGNDVSRLYELWRQWLLEARGELEALIDFSEDQHFDESPATLMASVSNQVQTLVDNVEIFKKNALRGELLRKGIGIALIGEPNAGKSSLLNTILGREAAIVNEEAGTTRDIIEAGLDIRGWYCRISDTAGFREDAVPGSRFSHNVANTISEVEREGMRRARRRVLESDLIIGVLPVEAIENLIMYKTDYRLRLDQQVLEIIKESHENGKGIILVINKIDRINEDRLATVSNLKKAVINSFPFLSADQIFTISCNNASKQEKDKADPGNIHQFLNGLIGCFQRMTAAITGRSNRESHQIAEMDRSVWESSLGASERHRLLLEDCKSHLEAFLALTRPDSLDEESIDIVVAAESLRSAATSLGKITGRDGGASDVEEVLGVVFEK